MPPHGPGSGSAGCEKIRNHPPGEERRRCVQSAAQGGSHQYGRGRHGRPEPYCKQYYEMYLLRPVHAELPLRRYYRGPPLPYLAHQPGSLCELRHLHRQLSKKMPVPGLLPGQSKRNHHERLPPPCKAKTFNVRSCGERRAPYISCPGGKAGSSGREPDACSESGRSHCAGYPYPNRSGKMFILRQVRA